MAKSKIEKELTMERKNASLVMDDAEIKKAEDFCKGYMEFMATAKTGAKSTSSQSKRQRRLASRSFILATSSKLATRFTTTTVANR